MDVKRVLKYTRKVKTCFLINSKTASDKKPKTVGKSKIQDNLNFSANSLYQKQSPQISHAAKAPRFIIPKKNLPSVLLEIVIKRLKFFWGKWTKSNVSRPRPKLTKSNSYFPKPCPKLRLIKTKSTGLSKQNTSLNISKNRNTIQKLESALSLVKAIHKPEIHIMEKSFQLIKKRANFYRLKSSFIKILKTRLETTLKAITVFPSSFSFLKISKIDPICIQPSPRHKKRCFVTKEISLNLAPSRFTCAPLTIVNKNLTISNDRLSVSSQSICLPNVLSAESLCMSFNKDEIFCHIQDLNEEDGFSYERGDVVEFRENELELRTREDRLKPNFNRDRYAIYSSRETVLENPFLVESDESFNLFDRRFEGELIEVSGVCSRGKHFDVGTSLQSNTTSSKNSKYDRRLKEIVLKSLRFNVRSVKCMYKGVEIVTKMITGKIQGVFNQLY